ncbi:serine protease inhibitor 88Ea-like [Chrysoperla carnea]|uniref:serine protease inhibitor 88Ea-like n=1 Tax=Chrysoperla carnea TaxID=189513 RepID=UPI001D061482|nr:serine protease inhibitor 88Ea-like [Chrysoperla carnea]XP_044728179.1 serine protease inhibitor 88Ea-like [Chrysoperla carnea]
MIGKIIFVLAAACVVTIKTQCLTENDNVPQNTAGSRNAQDELYTGQQQFSLDMLKEVNNLDPQSSIFFSPYSTYHTLLLSYFIAKNETEQAVKYALRLPESQDKLSTFRAFRFEKYLRAMSAVNQTSYEFESANRIFVSNDAGVRDCMLEMFDDEIEKLDFQQNPEQSRQYINKWVESVTKSQIKDLLIPGSIDETTNLVLANAAYFKGMWESKFDAESTTKSVFYISGSEKTFVDMMNQEGTFNHDVSEELGAHVLELPYIGNDVSMFIFLPPFATENGLDNVLAKLNVTTFQELVRDGGLYPKKVFVSLPKFSVEQAFDLKPVLESMGVGNLFSSGDLSALTGQNNLNLSDAVHKAKIEVNEEGTESAAATAFFSFRSSRPVEPAMFVCNHPFIYVIFDRSSQAVLFAGVFRKP